MPEIERLKERIDDQAKTIRQQRAKVEKLREAINHATVVMGSTGDYRQGQLDALELCRGLIADTEEK